MLQVQTRYCWCLGLIFILFLNISSAIRINEVSPKSEFIEIYSEKEINISEWRIKDLSNNNPDLIECLNCIVKGYLVIVGKSFNASDYFYVDDQNLGNGLNDNGDSISFFNIITNETYSFSYNSSSIKSWQYFDDGWKSCNETPGRENQCEIIENKSENNIEKQESKVEDKISEEKNEVEIKIENITVENPENEEEDKEIVRLNPPKDIKTNKSILFKSKIEYMKEYGIYGFAIFCIFIIIILLIKNG